MNRILFYIVLVSLLVSAPVAIKYAVDAKRTQKDLMTQIEAASVVRAELTQVSDSLKSKNGQIVVLSGQLDSVAHLLSRSSLRIDELNARQFRMSKTIDSLNGAFKRQLEKLEAQRAEMSSIHSQLADTLKILSDTRDRLDTATQRARAHDLFLVQLHPWYLKWKHDATERNWLEKLFGADRATTPVFPEPPFPELPRLPLDSLTADTTARLQAQR